MRIQSINSVYVGKVQNRKNVHREVPVQENVSFCGAKLKFGLMTVGAVVGTVVAGPTGAVIGAAAGLKGAQLVEADDDDDDNPKKPDNRK